MSPRQDRAARLLRRGTPVRRRTADTERVLPRRHHLRSRELRIVPPDGALPRAPADVFLVAGCRLRQLPSLAEGLADAVVGEGLRPGWLPPAGDSDRPARADGVEARAAAGGRRLHRCRLSRRGRCGRDPRQLQPDRFVHVLPLDECSADDAGVRDVPRAAPWRPRRRSHGQRDGRHDWANTGAYAPCTQCHYLDIRQEHAKASSGSLGCSGVPCGRRAGVRPAERNLEQGVLRVPHLDPSRVRRRAHRLRPGLQRLPRRSRRRARLPPVLQRGARQRWHTPNTPTLGCHTGPDYVPYPRLGPPWTNGYWCRTCHPEE